MLLVFGSSGFWDGSSDDLKVETHAIHPEVKIEASALRFHCNQGLLFQLFKGGFKVSSGTVDWHRSSSGTDFEIPYTIHYILYTIYHLVHIL